MISGQFALHLKTIRFISVHYGVSVLPANTELTVSGKR